MDKFSIFDFLFDFFYNIRNLWETIYNFLFYKVSFNWLNNFIIKVSDFLNINPPEPIPDITLWTLMTGAGLIVVLVLVIIKKVIPAMG